MTNTEIAKNENTQKTEKRTAITRLTENLELGNPGMMIRTIKAQCFQGTDPDKVTDEQLGAYVSVAVSLNDACPQFNPLLPGFLYAYPTRNGGTQCMIGPDGIYCLLANHPDIAGWDVEEKQFDKDGNIVSVTGKIHLKSSPDYPRKKTVYFSEWNMPSNPNWKSRPVHMLETRAIKQCARMVIHGIPMDKEEVEISEMVEAEIVKDQQPLLTDPAERFKQAHIEQNEVKHGTKYTGPNLIKDKPDNSVPPADDSDLPDDSTPSDSKEWVSRNGSEAYIDGHSREDNPFDGDNEPEKWAQWDTLWNEEYQIHKSGELEQP